MEQNVTISMLYFHLSSVFHPFVPNVSYITTLHTSLYVLLWYVRLHNTSSRGQYGAPNCRHEQTRRPSRRLFDFFFLFAAVAWTGNIICMIVISHHLVETFFKTSAILKCLRRVFSDFFFFFLDHRLSAAPTIFSRTTPFAAFGFTFTGSLKMYKNTQEMNARYA